MFFSFIRSARPARVSLAAMLSAAASLAASAAFALSLSDLTSQEASTGLKAALEKGSSAAVARLGVPGGFLDNDRVRIRLPDMLQQARPLLQIAGRGRQLDELEAAMNRAAESAVPMAKPLLLNAVKSMTVSDAKAILSGGETSVTDFFRGKTSEALSTKFLPIVKSVTDRSGLAGQYNATVSQVSRFHAVPAHQSTVEGYVTQRALDGLFLVIAEEEKAIRRDPLGSGSRIIGKVFGAVR